MKVTLRNRRNVRWAFLALLVLVVPSPLLAQEPPSPYTRDHLHQVVGVGVGGGLAFWGGWLEDTRAPLTNRELNGLDPGQVNGLDRVATEEWSTGWRRVSDIGLGALLGGTVLMAGVEGGRALNDGRKQDALTLALMTSEMVLLTLGVTTATKGLVGRIRPYAYNPFLSLEERSRLVAEEGTDVFSSFFSGHTSLVFAAATFSSTLMTDIHGTSGWTDLMWGSTLGLAGLTGYARVRAGMHFPTDVLVGGLVGSGMGFLVTGLHSRSGGDDGAWALNAPLQLSFRIPF